VHSTRRELALRKALPRAYERAREALLANGWPLPSGTLLLPLIATAPRDHGHPDGPAGPVWALWQPDPTPPPPSPRPRAARPGAEPRN
jgi:hypothetical protein